MMQPAPPENESDDDSSLPASVLTVKKKSGCQVSLELYAPHSFHLSEGGDDALELKIDPVLVKNPNVQYTITSRPGESGRDEDEDKRKRPKKRQREEAEMGKPDVKQPTFPAPVHGNGQVPVAFLEVVEKEAVRRCRAVFKLEDEIAALKDYILTFMKSPSANGTLPPETTAMAAKPGEKELVAPETTETTALPAKPGQRLVTEHLPPPSPEESSGAISDDDSQYANTELPVPSETPDIFDDGADGD